MRRLAKLIIWGSALFLLVACWKGLILAYLPTAASNALVNTLASILAFVAAFLSIFLVLLGVSTLGLIISPLQRRLNSEHLRLDEEAVAMRNRLDEEAAAMREREMLEWLMRRNRGVRSQEARKRAEPNELGAPKEKLVGAAAGPRFRDG